MVTFNKWILSSCMSLDGVVSGGCVITLWVVHEKTLEALVGADLYCSVGCLAQHRRG